MTQIQAQNESKTPLEKQQSQEILPTPNPINNSQQTPLTQIQQVAHVQQADPEITQIDEINPLMLAYFEEKSTANRRNKSMAVDLTQQKTLDMKECIRQGYINISQQVFLYRQVRLFIGDIISRTSPIAKEQQKLNEYLQQKNELENELRRMEDMIKMSNGETRSNSISPKKKDQEPISPQQHKKFVERITKLRRQNQEKRKMTLEYQQNRLKELQKKEQQSDRDKKQMEMIQRRNYLKQKLQNILKRRQKMKEEDMQAKKRFKSVCEQKRRHQIMEQSYQSNILLPSIEEKNKILEERSRQFNSIKIQEIKLYEQQYIKSKEQMQQKSRKRQSQSWNYKAPSYSARIIKILQEQQLQEKIRQQQEKRKMEELKMRQENYKQYLKERLSSVRIDEKKRLEMSTLISKEKSSKDGLSQSSMKDLGNKYLQQIKTKIKSVSKDKKESLSTNQERRIPKIKETYKTKSSTSMSNYLNHSNNSDIAGRNIDSIISSASSKTQKMQKLKIEVEKMSEKAERKNQIGKFVKSKREEQEDIDGLLNSIKAKVSIIELYKK